METSILRQPYYFLLTCLMALSLFSCFDEAPTAVNINKSFSDFEHDENHPAFNRELIFAIEGDTISGYGFIANDSTLKETIILVAGYPGNDNNFDLAQALRRNGKNVIHFNHRGAWGSQGQYTYSSCLEDIDKVIEYLTDPSVANDLRIDTSQITLIGRSYGGGIALIQGSQNKYVKKIIAITSVNYGALMNNYKDLSELGGFKRYMVKQVMIDTDIDLFLQELLDKKEEFNILAFAKFLKNKKVLILEDSDKNDKWTSQLTDAKIVKFESGHNFIDKRIEMIDLIVDWINEN